jgi:cytochrome c oxidase subunit 3
MATTLVLPAPAPEASASENDIIGIGGGPADPGDDPHDNPGPDPDQEASLSTYRMITVLAMVWIVFLFAAIAVALKWRWANAPDWVSISLPHVLYVNTAILLLSSLTMECARFSLRARGAKHCTGWVAATLLLGLAFIGGQLVVWRELALRGLHLASNPGSFFFYLLTGTHGVHLLVGVAALASVGLFVTSGAQRFRREAAVSVIALYWHFLDALWICVLALLFLSIQR